MPKLECGTAVYAYLTDTGLKKTLKEGGQVSTVII